VLGDHRLCAGPHNIEDSAAALPGIR
jgi:hypothetical protein